MVETPQGALDDIHLQTVRERLGSNIVITGNIDPVGRIYSGAPKSIREQILNAYDQVGNPYMVNAGCEIPSGTPRENLSALCEPIPFQRGFIRQTIPLC